VGSKDQVGSEAGPGAGRASTRLASMGRMGGWRGNAMGDWMQNWNLQRTGMTGS
jgi:hypothetical protein